MFVANITARPAKITTAIITIATGKLSTVVKSRPIHLKRTSQEKIKSVMYSLISNVLKMKYWNAIVVTDQVQGKSVSTVKPLGAEPLITGRTCVWRTKFAKPA